MNAKYVERFFMVYLNLCHCVKIVHIRSFSSPYFPALGLNDSILSEVIWQIGNKELGSTIIIANTPSFQYWYLWHVSLKYNSYDIASYADDNTPYIGGLTKDPVKTKSGLCCTSRFKWFMEKPPSYIM